MKPGHTYRQLKSGLNSQLDRIVNRADERLRMLEGVSPTFRRKIYRRLLNKTTKACWWIQQAPRVDAWRWSDCNWSVIYVGTDSHSAELKHLLCPGEQVPEALERVNVWNLSRKSQQWAGEADLVVCELNRHQPKNSTATYSFTMAPWIRMVLDVTDPAEAIMARMRKDVRSRLRKVLKSGFFTCRFSHDLADFDLFYHSMFLPFLNSRFQERGIIAPYNSLLAEFQKGGLIMAEQEGRPVSGMMYLHTRDTLYSTWEGILEGNYELMRAGVQLARWWFAVQLTQQLGCRYYDLGRAVASLQNGMFRFKLGWGAQIKTDYRLHETWTFLSRGLSPDLRAHLNEQQFLSGVEDQHFIVFLTDPNDPRDEQLIAERLTIAQDHGLAGVLLVKPGDIEKQERQV